MNNIIKGAAEAIIKRLPLKNIIIFESFPDFSDNSRAVFDEMIKQGINKDYLLVWTTHGAGELPEVLKGIENVTAENMNSAKYKYYYSYFAKAIIVSNYFMQKRREEQYYIFLTHGLAMKGIKDNRYSIPEYCYGCDFSALSYESAALDVEMLNTDRNNVNIVELGFARNDILSKKNEKVNELFDNKRIICWLPTFRQNKNDNTSHSSVSIPFLDDIKSAEMINNCAEENDIIIVIKPHPLQDLSSINNLSNIKVVDEKYLSENGLGTYELLANSNALLSDYSSVYYDYLLCDKPIGLCWEDIEEYKQLEGLKPDAEENAEGAEIINTVNELCRFIKAVANNEDSLHDKRNEIKNRIHKYTDFRFAERTVEHIMKKIKDAQ